MQIDARLLRGSVPRIEASNDLGGEQPHIPDLNGHVVFYQELVDVGRGACLT